MIKWDGGEPAVRPRLPPQRQTNLYKGSLTDWSTKRSERCIGGQSGDPPSLFPGCEHCLVKGPPCDRMKAVLQEELRGLDVCPVFLANVVSFPEKSKERP